MDDRLWPRTATIATGLVWADMPLGAVFALIAAVNLAMLGALEAEVPVLAQRHFRGLAYCGAIVSRLGLGVTAGAATAASRTVRLLATTEPIGQEPGISASGLRP